MAGSMFEYWRPGAEERKLRLFISHRYGADEALYTQVIAALEREGFAVQDVSLTKDQVLTGPRGGDVPISKIQADIAARIFTADVLIAPSRVGVTGSEWLTWEIQLAVIGYGLPVLFVNHEGQKNKSRLVAEVEALGVPCRVCDAMTTQIVRGVTDLVDGRPRSAMRLEEPDPNFRFRGPPSAARQSVLARFPFEPRFPPEQTAPQRKGLWSRLSGGEAAS